MIVSLRCDCAFFLEKLEIIMCRLWRPECVARHFEIDEYTPIEEVNRLCEMVEDLPEYIQEELSELQSYFGSIEELCEHEDDIICHSGCDDMADVARCYLEESGQLGELPAHLQNYIDYAAYGRDMELEGTFVVTNHGVYEILR